MGCCNSNPDPTKEMNTELPEQIPPNLLASNTDCVSQKLSNGSAERSSFPLRRCLSVKKGRLSIEYDVRDIIGEGSFGTVRRVISKYNQDERAAKSILKSYVEQAEYLFSEVEILRTLDHPNILRIFEVIEDLRYYHIITGLYTGGDLLDKMVSNHGMSEGRACSYFHQLVSGVSYCHTNDIVHQDLKPDNLLFRDQAEDSPLIIIDFGLSHVKSKAPCFNKYGSSLYSAPEALQGCVSKESDVWSCGVILYFMLCGYLPYSGKSEKVLLKQINEAPLNFPSEEWSSVSKEAIQLITLMLEKDPTKRITAAEVLNQPWVVLFLHKPQIDRKICISALEKLYAFRASLRLTHAVLEFIAAHYSAKDELHQLQSVFLSFDANADGMLSREELIGGINALELPHLNAEEILDGCDANRNGHIDYTEFLTACANWHKMFSKDKLKRAFEAFDRDNSGYIDLNELKTALGGAQTMSEEGWMAIMNEVDLNGDGVIDMDEFEEALINKGDALGV